MVEGSFDSKWRLEKCAKVSYSQINNCKSYKQIKIRKKKGLAFYE